MDMDTELNPDLGVEDLAPIIRTWDLRLAQLISNFLSPPIMAGGALFALGATVPGAWRWVGIYSLLVVILPVLFLIYQLQSGEVSSFNLPIREERYKLIGVVVLMSFVGWLTMMLVGAPYALSLFSGIGVLIIILILLITFYWKISAHATAMSGFSVFIVAFWGWDTWPILFAIPLMAWARIRTHSHSFWQTVAGSFTGAGFIFVVVSIISWQCNGIGLSCR